MEVVTVTEFERERDISVCDNEYRSFGSLKLCAQDCFFSAFMLMHYCIHIQLLRYCPCHGEVDLFFAATVWFLWVVDGKVCQRIVRNI